MGIHRLAECTGTEPLWSCSGVSSPCVTIWPLLTHPKGRVPCGQAGPGQTLQGSLPRRGSTLNLPATWGHQLLQLVQPPLTFCTLLESDVQQSQLAQLPISGIYPLFEHPESSSCNSHMCSYFRTIHPIRDNPKGEGVC